MSMKHEMRKCFSLGVRGGEGHIEIGAFYKVARSQKVKSSPKKYFFLRKRELDTKECVNNNNRHSNLSYKYSTR